MELTKLQSTVQRVEALEKVVEPFAERAYKHDLDASFPKENIADLKKAGYHLLSLPKEYGGLDISLLELVQLQETIAKSDGSTALAIGWHIGIVKNLAETRPWDQKLFEKFCKDVVNDGALINSAASEPATGSPTRGGKPETLAIECDGGFRVTGRKTFTTLAPVLDYFLVTATIEGTDYVGNFLIHKNSDGVSIEETWDSVAMRATGSHDLLLENVFVTRENLVGYVTPGKKQAQGWLLHIPACYLGIAKAAQRYAVTFAKSYCPNSIEGSIAELPYVRQKIGEMELYVQQSEHFLYSVARKWDEASAEVRQQMLPELGAVKHSIVNHAIQVVDLAMRVTGARSLSEKNLMQRYYRDVRAGLHNPPMDDAILMLLAERSLQ